MQPRLASTRLLGARLCPGRRPSLALGHLGTALAVVCLAVLVAPAASLAQSTMTLVIGQPHHGHHRHHRRSSRGKLPARSGPARSVSAPSFCPIAATAANAQATAASVQTMRDAVVCLINQQRQVHGLPPVVLSSALDTSAQEWTQQMVATGDYAHGNFLSRILGAGYPGQLIGENIDTNAPTPEAVVKAWMASPDHCQNILDPSFRDVGVGEAPAAVGWGGPATWTMDLGLSRYQTALSSNWAPWRSCG